MEVEVFSLPQSRLVSAPAPSSEGAFLRRVIYNNVGMEGARICRKPMGIRMWYCAGGGSPPLQILSGDVRQHHVFWRSQKSNESPAGHSINNMRFRRKPMGIRKTLLRGRSKIAPTILLYIKPEFEDVGRFADSHYVLANQYIVPQRAANGRPYRFYREMCAPTL